MKVFQGSLNFAIPICLFLFTIHSISALPASIEATDTITGITTWSADTVKVTGDIEVIDSAVLTINPGTVVEFQGHYTIHVIGTLLAVGLPDEKITFTIHDTTGFSNPDTSLGGWNSIFFDGNVGDTQNNDTSFITHCIVQYSKNLHQDDHWPDSTGGAIRARTYSKLVISDSRITHNMSLEDGGGINCYKSSINILHNEIDSNMAYACGGGIACYDASPVIKDNYIHHNTGGKNSSTGNELFGAYESGGGGIFCYYSKADIERNTIDHNQGSRGAGINSCNSKDIIRNNIFAYNETWEFDEDSQFGEGGGIFTWESIDRIENNVFSNNTASWGGAIHISSNSPQVINNLVTNNICQYSGGGIHLYDCRSMLLNNTIANNHSGEKGGGIAIDESKPGFINNILWGNTQDETGPGSQIVTDGGISNPDISYSVIQGGIVDISGNYQGQFYEVLESDPSFLNPSAGSGSGFDGLTADWSLDTGSNCLNRGMPSIDNYTLPALDIYGKDRIKHGRIDIGASEIQIPSISIEGSISKDTIVIADTIKVTGDIVIEDNHVLTIAPGTRVEFQGHYSIEVLGTLYAPGTDKYPIVFTSHDTTGFSTDTVTDGSWSGIRFPNKNGDMSDNDTSILEYCLVEFVKHLPAEKPGQALGGAIVIRDFSRIKLRHCTIRNNISPDYAGGIFAVRSEPVILNCIISYNTRGGIYIQNSEIIIRHCEISHNTGGGIGSERSKVCIENNLIYRNSAPAYGGGGLELETTSGIIRNNRIINNISPGTGGGANFNTGTSAPEPLEFTGNIVSNNTAESGGGIYIYNSDNVRLINNTICFNEALKKAGGVQTGSSITFINNLIWGNRSINDPDYDKCQIYYDWNATGLPSIFNCNIQHGLGGIISEAFDTTEILFENNIHTEPHFVSPPSGPGSGIEAIHADFSLLPISGNINSGMEDTNGLMLPRTDIYSNPRMHDQRLDIGAAENQDKTAIILEQPDNHITCEGDTILLQIRTSDTVNYQWQKNGMDIPGAVYPGLKYDSVTLKDEGNYRCIISNAYGNVQSNQVFLVIRKAPEILTAPASQWIEPGKLFTLKVNVDGTMPLFYQWEKNGIPVPGAIAPEYTLSEPDYPDEGRYSCIISNGCGMDTTAPATLYLAPQICMVTISETTGSNLVVWEKKSTAPIAFYNIYRESKYAGIYDLLKTIPYNDLSVYPDTTANPTIQAYLYKITAKDTSGYETDPDLCRSHKTMHLLATKNPETNSSQLDWDRYVGFDYGTYEIFRSDTTFDFTPIHSMSSSTSTWTDANPGTGNKFYRIAAVKPEPCFPEGENKKATDSYTYSFSNIDDNKKQPTGTEHFAGNNEFIIYPNPFMNRATIQFPNPMNEEYQFILTDLSGKLLRIVDHITTSEYVLEKDRLKEGLYFIELRGPEIYRGKIVIE